MPSIKYRDNGTWKRLSGGGSGGGGGDVSWGDIGGTLSNQTDLNTALGGKANSSDIPTKLSELNNDVGYTTNAGTITGITMNGSSKGTSGVVDLGTVITSHQDISGKADANNTTSGTYRSVSVNSQGIVTAGTNPTTLSGYGITDAKISGSTVTLGSNSVTVPSVPNHITVGSSSDYIIWHGTQAQYNAIATKGATTIYLITG